MIYMNIKIQYLFKILLISLMVNNVAFSQRNNVFIKPTLQKVLNEKESSFMIDLILEGDITEISKIVREYNGILKFSKGNYTSVRVPLASVKALSSSNKIKPIQFSIEKAVALNDTMRVRNRVTPVHEGQNPLIKSYTGKDVIIGLIDTGIDFNHPDFQNPDGTTRVLAIWDQSMPLNATYTPATYGYGQAWDSAQINAGLCTHDVRYTHHGSTVTGTAAGNGLASGDHMGVAPNADIIMVKTNFSVNNWYATFVDAVDFIFTTADFYEKPCVVNASVGSYLGSHDGKDASALLVDELLNEKPGRLLVCSAGNSGGAPKYHVHNDVDSDTTFTWFKVNNSSAFGFPAAYVDIWTDTLDFNSVDFAIGADKTSPNYEFRGRSEFKNLKLDNMVNTMTLDSIYNGTDVLTYIEYYVTEDNGRYELEVFLPNPDSSQYNFRFITTTSEEGSYDMWGASFLGISEIVSLGLPTETDFPVMSKYITPDTLQTVVTSYACSDNVITVANYTNNNTYIDFNGVLQLNTLVPNELHSTSSKGPSRQGSVKPDIGATGGFTFSATSIETLNVWKSLDPSRVHQSGWHMSNGGTSMASPVVAGIAALLLEKCPNITTDKFKEIITSTAFQDSYTGNNLPDYAFGYGKVDAFNALISTNFSPVLNDENICEGNDNNFTTDILYSSYKWHDGSTDNTFSITNNTVGYLIVEDQYGCVSDTAHFSIEINPVPEKPTLLVEGNDIIGSEALSHQWYFNGDILSGETNKNTTAIESGKYQLEVFNENGCSTLSDPIQINRFDNGVAIYPNPVSDNLTVKIDSGSEVDVKLYDVTGKLLINKLSITSDFNIDMSVYESATYYIIIEKDGIESSKISLVKN